LCSDHPAGQAYACQGPVGGLMYLQGTRAGVVVAGPGHPLTVRRRCWADSNASVAVVRGLPIRGQLPNRMSVSQKHR
jgi:hypothetical protein